MIIDAKKVYQAPKVMKLFSGNNIGEYFSESRDDNCSSGSSNNCSYKSTKKSSGGGY